MSAVRIQYSPQNSNESVERACLTADRSGALSFCFSSSLALLLTLTLSLFRVHMAIESGISGSNFQWRFIAEGPQLDYYLSKLLILLSFRFPKAVRFLFGQK